MFGIDKLTESIVALTKVLRLRQPGRVRFKLVYEGKEMSKFVLVLPPAGAADVTERALDYTINSGPIQELVVAPDATYSPEFEANVGDVIDGQLVDIDDAANQSEPRLFNLVLSDNLAPPVPGEVGVQMTEETDPPL